MSDQTKYQDPGPKTPVRRKLYDSMVGRGLYTKSFEEFEGKINNPQNIEKLYSGLKEKQLYTKDLESFKAQFFSDVPGIKRISPKIPPPVQAPPPTVGADWQSVNAMINQTQANLAQPADDLEAMAVEATQRLNGRDVRSSAKNVLDRGKKQEIFSQLSAPDLNAPVSGRDNTSSVARLHDILQKL